MKCPSNMVQKVDIKEVVENGVFFQDGSYEQVDSILYCTGKHSRRALVDNIYFYTYYIVNQISCTYLAINMILVLF